MFCIAAFVVFGILGIFSARYREIARKSWGCVIKRVTFKPCDVSIQEEIKSKLMGKFILTRPRLAKFIDKWANLFAWTFVILSVWSLLVVAKSGLNLFVYDTCNPDNPESCSLSSGGCGVVSGRPGFWFSLKEGQLLTWTKEEVSFFGETISRIPDRLKKRNPEEYLGSTNTYFMPYDENKTIALEIIDPSCKFCAKLFTNIKETNFANIYNLTYLVYPIPDPTQPNGYKFPHSYLIASYLEAVKAYPLEGEVVSSDWKILENIFIGKDSDNILYQNKFNTLYTKQEAENKILEWLLEIGYSTEQIENIKQMSKSDFVANKISEQKDIVENKVRTIKIPTIMFEGRRYDRAVEQNKLN